MSLLRTMTMTAEGRGQFDPRSVLEMDDTLDALALLPEIRDRFQDAMRSTELTLIGRALDEGTSYADIARVTGLSRQAVRQRYQYWLGRRRPNDSS